MKKGQTLIAADGYEVCLYPLNSIRITQTHYGTTSHSSNEVKNTGLFDVTGQDGDETKGVIYAPFTCKVVAIKTGYNNGNQVVVVSTDKVHLANGSLAYAIFSFGHDNKVDVVLGKIYKQGTKLGDCGNYGNVTGVHSHFMLGTGEWTYGNYIPLAKNKNNVNIFYMPNAIDIDDMFYINGITIDKIAKVINKSKSSTKSYDTVTQNSDGTITQVTYCDATNANKNFKVTNIWRTYTGDSIDISKFIVEQDSSKHQLEVKEEKLRARKTPTNVDDSNYYGIQIPVGWYNILETTEANSLKWCKIAENLWCAITGTCCEEHQADTTDYKEKYELEVKKYEALEKKYNSLVTANEKLTDKVTTYENKIAAAIKELS